MKFLSREKLQQTAFNEISLRNDRAEKKAKENYFFAMRDKEFATLEKERCELIQKIAKCSVECSDSSEFEKRHQEVVAHIDEILKKYKLTSKDLKPNYSCKSCNDTGYLPNGQICKCLNKLISEFGSKEDIQSMCDFPCIDDFKVDIFTDSEKGISRKDFLKRYIDKFPSKRALNILLQGPAGTGKTFFAKTIARAINEKDFSVIFVTAYSLNQAMLNSHLSKEIDKTKDIEHYMECELLVIDDLGTEPILKNVTKEYFTLLINERIASGRNTIITTNLTNEGIMNRYDERFLDRITNIKNSVQFGFFNNSLRKVK